MAAATRARRPVKTKPAPEPEVVEEELEEEELEDTADGEDEGDEDLEELEEDEVVEEKPASKKASRKTDAVNFGIQDLVKLVKKETTQDTDPRSLRTLIRKMARDESGRVKREITAGNRTRYDWSGPNDPEVRNILEAFKAGELEEDKKAKLAALKERKAAQNAAKAKAAAEAEVEEVDEDEEEEAPKPRRRVAPKKAAPARRTRKAPVEEVEDDEELDLDDE